MTDIDLFLTVQTALHRYIVRRDQVHHLQLVSSDDDLEQTDERGKPIINCELAPLLDARDRYNMLRYHALIVRLRRRSVALLVDRIEDARVYTEASERFHPLPPLLSRQLHRPWFLGVLIRDEVPLLVLDLRQIAQDVLMNQHQTV
jgi:chemotaxis signal transduction protein